MRTFLFFCVVTLLLLEANGFRPRFPIHPGPTQPGPTIPSRAVPDEHSCLHQCYVKCITIDGCVWGRTVAGMCVAMCNEKKSVGVWMRYETENMKEFFKMLGLEEWYGDAEEWEASNTIEQDGVGRFTETWEQNGLKIVMTLDYFGNRVTMKQPGFELESKLSDMKNGWFVFELDGIIRINYRQYVGNDKYITHAIYTRKSDGNTVHYKEYYKRML